MLDQIMNNFDYEVEQRIKNYMEYHNLSKDDMRNYGKKVTYQDKPLEEYFYYKNDLICRTQLIIKDK